MGVWVAFAVDDSCLPLKIYSSACLAVGGSETIDRYLINGLGSACDGAEHGAILGALACAASGDMACSGD